jgi:hypothetical protein
MASTPAIIAKFSTLAHLPGLLFKLWHNHRQHRPEISEGGVLCLSFQSPVVMWLKRRKKISRTSQYNQIITNQDGQDNPQAAGNGSEANLPDPDYSQRFHDNPNPQEKKKTSLWHSLVAPHNKTIGTGSENQIAQPLSDKGTLAWVSWAEILLIIAWAIFVGRAYLDFSPNTWLYGSDYPLQILGYYVWRLLPTCGACVFWNGSVSGGWPAFSEVFNGTLHPLVLVSTLLFGAINATKVVVVASMAMAGIAQWWLARVMRLSTLPRLWVAMIAVAGGQLSGRMDMGLIVMYLSIAAASLVIAPAVEFALTGRRKAAIWLGICTALAVLSGQGYMQLGLLFGVAPAYLILLWGKKLRQLTFQINLLIAGGLAFLISAVNWLPLARFWGNIVKSGDPIFFGAQPIQYIPLNMLISDYGFYTTEALQKKSFPAFYMDFIGWIPVLLAIATIFLVPRKARRC